MRGRVLIIAGSDSGGGAGIQADIKTTTALEGYAATALTALTAQNTQGVSGIEGVPPAFIEAQIDAVLTDIGADAVKTGMLHAAPVIHAVVSALDHHAFRGPLVVDPVMYAKGGASLLADEARQTLVEQLIPKATLLTPNIPEAEALSGMTIADEAQGLAAARTLLSLGPQAVLLKGGHLPAAEVVDLLVTAGAVGRFVHPRQATRHTHGTGCTLASAAATGLAQGLDLEAAVGRAIAYVQRALATAPGYGRGHGPLNHGHTVTPFPAPSP